VSAVPTKDGSHRADALARDVVPQQIEQNSDEPAKPFVGDHSPRLEQMHRRAVLGDDFESSATQQVAPLGRRERSNANVN
jgi:hypothetical protein